jgi:DNA-binding HxlR family transcriptional regulator
MGERQFDKININGVPLAEVLKDQRDNRIIEVRGRQIAVQRKHSKQRRSKKFVFAHHQKMSFKDRAPGKCRYLSLKEIEEVKMQRDVKKINTGGLTNVEAVYMAFKENDFKKLRSPEINYATRVNPGSISGILSTLVKHDILSREKDEIMPRRFYYRMDEAARELGREGFVRMYNDIVAKRKKSKKAKANRTLKAPKPSMPQGAMGKSTVTVEVKAKEVPSKSDQGIAANLHKIVDRLEVALEEAQQAGLSVELIYPHVDTVYFKVYREY